MAYVVDGQWLTTSKFKIEKDSTGIENNVIYPEDLSIYNEDLKSTIDENYTSFDAFSPTLDHSTESSSNQVTNEGSNNNPLNYRSDTDTSAFTNISAGDISPFESSDIDNRQNPIDNITKENDDESFKSIDSDDELFSSTQGTLMGTDTPVNGSCSNSINQQKNLVSLQNTNGSRQVRYYTSMSVLDRFKKYFK
ncbi:hypothetical protein BN7_1762 [Wickerhamomyces ciferrii]|uniref:Uncharacterized protein n=1 Tax=Wickerhamomyces ciferrii (strain ATCC 14091 / BCRC 22168 / CBS 111 / JCM 3599 / NBRC 0793 / NRRL Y-1031 F-60-10) TaxID=1206466 RepID=K0KM72_WICCF|nr:uncharacterized protein BN7_1762 [Wickerhamomyces ciferrii]CCH42218.1 hypothetical protein BN7_1762 [Wickerhamomyces ciferrii]